MAIAINEVTTKQIPIMVKGYNPARGYAQFWLGSYRAPRDADIIQVLKSLGAIPFCLTNVPQTLSSLTTSNPVFGTTRHPLDPMRSPGGSSGGESALISYGGSILGLGSDAAGSIRMPAHVCGIVGLKGTSDRVSKGGTEASYPGRTWLFASLGPMARDTESLVIFMRAVLDSGLMFQLNPYIVPVPFRLELFEQNKPLKIGYYLDNGLIVPIPACKRAVLEAKDTLNRAGHEIIPINSPDIKSHLGDLIGVMYPDSGAYFYSLMSRDIVDKYHWPHYFMYSLPNVVRRSLGALLQPIDPLLGEIFSGFASNTCESREKHANAAAFRVAVLQQWQALGLDGVICPVSAGVAYPHAFHAKNRIVASYTAVYNMLDFAAGTARGSTVTAEDDRKLAKDYVGTGFFAKNLKRANAKSEGLPVGVQCVSYPHHEEVVLRMMRDLEEFRG